MDVHRSKSALEFLSVDCTTAITIEEVENFSKRYEKKTNSDQISFPFLKVSSPNYVVLGVVATQYNSRHKLEGLSAIVSL